MQMCACENAGLNTNFCHMDREKSCKNDAILATVLSVNGKCELKIDLEKLTLAPIWLPH